MNEGLSVSSFLSLLWMFAIESFPRRSVMQRVLGPSSGSTVQVERVGYRRMG